MAAFAFELAPQFVGAEQKRDVGGILEIGLADDARLAVAGALVVRGSELLETEDFQAASGEMIDSGTAHAAEAENDDVVGAGHAITLLY